MGLQEIFIVVLMLFLFKKSLFAFKSNPVEREKLMI